MANQPPVRPWFRLAGLRPAPAPAPAPASAPSHETRPPLVLSTLRTNSAPSPPKAQPAQPSEPSPAPAPKFVGVADKASAPSSPAREVSVHSASLPTSPLQKGEPTTFSSVPSSPPKGATTAHEPSPSQSLKTTHPTGKTPPPSPLTLPPTKLNINSEIEPRIPVEPESKNVIVQKTIEKPKQSVNGNGETRKPSIGHNGKHNHRKLSDSEDSSMRVITIAGENRGAYMELIQSPKKHEFGDKPNYLHKKGNPKTKSDGSGSESSSSREGNGNKKDKSNRGRRTQSSYPMAAFMNSNVQCVNNSLLHNTSCTHHDPGVRLSLSKKPFGAGFQQKEIVNGQQHN